MKWKCAEGERSKARQGDLEEGIVREMTYKQRMKESEEMSICQESLRVKGETEEEKVSSE